MGTARMKPGREFHGRSIARGSWRRSGISSVEVLVATAIIAVAATIAVPWILHARSAQRVNSCRGNLRTLTLALRAYHDSCGQFPPAAIWSTDFTASLALHHAERVDLVTRQNWAQFLLPYAN